MLLEPDQSMVPNHEITPPIRHVQPPAFFTAGPNSCNSLWCHTIEMICTKTVKQIPF